MKIGGVYNVRDIGGAKTRSGKRVREGLIYRSGNLNSISKKGKVILKNELGIRSDLDLRRKGEGGAGKKSVAGRDRTGTLAMVLEGILGMKKKDIFRDYELTYLSKHSNKSSYSFEYNVTHYLCDNGMTKDEIRYIRNLMLE